MTTQDLYSRTDIIYFGDGAYITKENLKDRALSIAKDLIASNNVNGEIYTRSLTFQFGSPFDEIDMEYDRDPDTNEWYTRCSLYNKTDDALTAIRSANGTDSPQNIADVIMDLIQELNIPVTQRQHTDEQLHNSFFQRFFEDIYNDLVQTTLDGEYGTWDALWVGKAINDPARPGYTMEIWGEEKDEEGREEAVSENRKCFSISICKFLEDGATGEALITELADTNYQSVKDNVRLAFDQFWKLPVQEAQFSKQFDIETPTFVLCLAYTKEEFESSTPSETYELNTLEDCISECRSLREQAKTAGNPDYYGAYVVAEDGSNPWRQVFEERALNLPENVFWFALDAEKCISIWFDPSGHEFRMKLEERAEDGSMGAHCKLLCDESYYTGDMHYGALCDTLHEVCNDAHIPSSTRSICDLADSIFNTYGLKIPGLSMDKPSLKDQIHHASSRRNDNLSDSVVSVAHYAKNESAKEAFLQADKLRNQTLNVCYSIPGYKSLPREDKNKLYDLVKKSISLSQAKENHLKPER